MKKRLCFLTAVCGVLSLCGLLAAQAPETIQFLYPQPGSYHASSRTHIILRLNAVTPDQITNRSACIQVRGVQSGVHSGRTRIASDGKTLLFKPDRPFAPGETVHVTLNPATGETGLSGMPFAFRFAVKQSQVSAPDEPADVRKTRKPMPFQGLHPDQLNESSERRVSVNNVSVPSDFPRGNMAISANNNPGDGYIYMNFRYGQPYEVMLDTSGTPVWYWRTWDYRRDFKVQKNGIISMLVRGGYGKPQQDTRANWGFIGLDPNLTVIDTFRAVMGYDTDEHELQVFEDGSVFLLGVIRENVDMSRYVEGGRTNARVDETMIQGFSPDGELTFAWAAWDYFNPADMEYENLQASSVDFPHMNAIDRDDDGHLLLSSRHLSEVTKINRNTGDIIWRLGGVHNEFTFINDPLNGFDYQHDIRALGNNRYTLFDNGNNRNPHNTRAVEYELDTLAMTATLVWEQRYPYDGYSRIMGNTQRLPNGNTLINWADWGAPKAYEVTPEGQVAFELWLDGYEVYRAFKFPWTGKSPVPYLVAESHEEAVALFINKFGDPDVDHYRIYGGASPNPTTLIGTSETTLAALTDLENQQTWYFRTTAVNGEGEESGYSNEEQVFINYHTPGENMVQNGDFASRQQDWHYNAFGGASADWLIEDGVSHFAITSGGAQSIYIQLVQLGMQLIQGEEYVFEFDAWADAPRTIEAMILEYGDDYTNFGQINPTYITPVHQHFTYPFTMEDQSDFNSLVVFLMGTSDIDVYLDNVSLKHDVNPQAVESRDRIKSNFRLIGNYPNPFNARTAIRFEVGEPTHVSIRLYDALGRLRATVCDRRFSAGSHQVFVDGSELSSGLYFCRLKAGGPGRADHIIERTSKIMLIK